MKILMVGRIGLLQKGGGDKLQILKTAEELRKKGIEVDVVDHLNFDPSIYDLIHVFQLDWTAETYLYVKKAKKFGKPVVLSPIHHNIDEVKKFDDEYVFDFRRIQKYIFKDQFKRDVFKNVYRSIFDFRKFKPLLFSIFIGLKKMHKRILEMVDIVLVQTSLEAKDLEKAYGVKIKWKIVLNGVGEHFITRRECKSHLNIKDYIICVGRIEPRKNQLNIIKAVKLFRDETKIDTKLVFIGVPSRVTHMEYTWRFNREVRNNDWIIYVNYEIPYLDMPCYYRHAKVGVSASWFETTGLTSLEAIFSGANAVAAGDRAKEYLGDIASYCSPDDINSIKEAIKKEYKAPKPVITEKMKKEYTWGNAAEATLKVYKKVLGSK